MSTLNVIIITNLIPDYRVPLYNALANIDELLLSVIHSGELVSAHQAVSFKEIRCQSIRLGKITIQLDIQKEAAAADVIILMFDLWWPMSTWLLMRWPEKVLLWGHGLGRNKFFNDIRIVMSKVANSLLLYEEPAARKFLERGIAPEKLFVAGNTIEVKNHGRSLQKRDRFLFVGRLQERKRVDVLIEAFSMIRERLPLGVGLLIVGGGDILPLLKLKTIELGIEGRVDFLGEVRDESILKQCFDRAIAYVSPGAVGLGVLHSFAYGVPIITDANIIHGPEVDNICDRETGIFYADGSQELGEWLVKFATDQGLSKSLGTSAYYHYRDKRQITHMVERMCKAIWYVGGRVY